MITIKSGHITPVIFMDKHAHVQLLKYERTNWGDVFTLEIIFDESLTSVFLTDSLKKIRKVLGDDVEITFA